MLSTETCLSWETTCIQKFTSVEYTCMHLCLESSPPVVVAVND